MYYLGWILVIIFTCTSVIIIDRFNVNSIKLLFWITYLFVVLLLTMRPETIPDYKSYYSAFVRINQSMLGTNFFVKEYTIGVEYGFIFLVYLFKSVFGLNFRLFLFVLISISLICTVHYMEKIMCLMSSYSVKERWINRYLLLGLLFSYIGLQYQGIALRAALSFCCFTIALYFWLEKKYIRSFVILFVGFTLHRLTIIGVGIVALYTILPLVSKEIVKKIAYGVIALLVLICLTGKLSLVLQTAKKVELFVFRYVSYSQYLEGVEDVGAFGKGALFVVFVIFVAMYMCKGGIILDRFVLLLAVGVILIFATSNISGAARIYDYFTLLLYPTLVQGVCQRKRQCVYLFFVSSVIFINSIISFRIWGVI